jgi:hypothetical protein
MHLLVFYKDKFREILSQKYTGLHAKYHLSCPIVTKLGYPTLIFQKILKYQISRKPIQLEQGCSMRTDRDMTKLTAVFRNFANATHKQRPEALTGGMQTCITTDWHILSCNRPFEREHQ